MIIKGIKSINNYSQEIKYLLVYFKSNFWKNLLNNFNNIEPESFNICLELRQCFNQYHSIIYSICNREKYRAIIRDINDFKVLDEFSYILYKNLKHFLRDKKGKLTNSEILGYIYIQFYNPYYIEPENKYRRDPYILDYLVYEYDIYSSDEDAIKDHIKFIKTFQKLEFEYIFQYNMEKFIELMVNKIKDISSFDTIMDLIRKDKIGIKIKVYLKKMKDKYIQIVKPEIQRLNYNKLKKKG